VSGLVSTADARERRIRELEAALAERERQIEALRESPADRELADQVRELRELFEQQREVLRDTARALSTLAAIRASNTWRLLEAWRGLRRILRLGTLPIELSHARGRLRRVPRAVLEAPVGVNVAGYLSTESGMGEAARASIRSLEAAGLPIALNNVPSFLRQLDATYSSTFTQANPHPFNLVHLNADNMQAFRARQGRRYFRKRYTIGYWFWELASFRQDWLDCFGYVDEVWVASEFVRAAIQPASPVPVVRMPLPVTPPLPPPYGRAHFGLSDRAVVFLYSFDVSSQTERKNPIGAIRAFRRAALPRDRATLVLKYTNAEYDRAAVRRFHEEAEGLDVVMLDGYMARPELTALMNCADCYLSLHRAEGFGLTILEAMRLGRPAIATAYSGNMDFMTPDNSYPVDYRLVTLARDYGPYARGFVWADPDLDSAARAIREVVEHPESAALRGRRALEDTIAAWSPEVTGLRVRARLEAIRSGRRFDRQMPAEAATA
jgi:glycosyltransferase involved in cell wall biosynthesis